METHTLTAGCVKTRLMDIFRERLRERLKAKADEGISAAEIARRLEISPSRLYNYTSTMREPQSFQLFCKMCDILGTSPNYMLGYSDTPDWPPEETTLSDLAAKIDALSKSPK